MIEKRPANVGLFYLFGSGVMGLVRRLVVGVVRVRVMGGKSGELWN